MKFEHYSIVAFHHCSTHRTIVQIEQDEQEIFVDLKDLEAALAELREDDKVRDKAWKEAQKK